MIMTKTSRLLTVYTGPLNDCLQLCLGNSNTPRMKPLLAAAAGYPLGILPIPLVEASLRWALLFSYCIKKINYFKLRCQMATSNMANKKGEILITYLTCMGVV